VGNTRARLEGSWFESGKPHESKKISHLHMTDYMVVYMVASSIHGKNNIFEVSIYYFEFLKLFFGISYL